MDTRKHTSKIIFKNAHYTACAMRDNSLIVTKNRTQDGRRLTAPSAAHWIEAIETSTDTSEASALCRALFN